MTERLHTLARVDMACTYSIDCFEASKRLVNFWTSECSAGLAVGLATQTKNSARSAGSDAQQARLMIAEGILLSGTGTREIKGVEYPVFGAREKQRSRLAALVPPHNRHNKRLQEAIPLSGIGTKDIKNVGRQSSVPATNNIANGNKVVRQVHNKQARLRDGSAAKRKSLDEA